MTDDDDDEQVQLPHPASGYADSHDYQAVYKAKANNDVSLPPLPDVSAGKLT